MNNNSAVGLVTRVLVFRKHLCGMIKAKVNNGLLSKVDTRIVLAKAIKLQFLLVKKRISD
jgi:hypothetical protein